MTATVQEWKKDLWIVASHKKLVTVTAIYTKLVLDAMRKVSILHQCKFAIHAGHGTRVIMIQFMPIGSSVLQWGMGTGIICMWGWVITPYFV